VLDLNRHGLLDDRLVLWSGELSCVVRRQNLGGDYGRNHHRCCFCVGLDGGGIKNTLAYGEIDDRGYNIVDQDTCGVRVYDLNAGSVQVVHRRHSHSLTKPPVKVRPRENSGHPSIPPIAYVEPLDIRIRHQWTDLLHLAVPQENH